MEWDEILQQEKVLIENAEAEHGEDFLMVMEFYGLLQSFLKEVKPEAIIFALFLSQVRKYFTLALFSALRLHDVQAKLNTRQLIEAGLNAAYGIAHENWDDYVAQRDDGVMDAPQSLAAKRYKWISANYPAVAYSLQKQKELINDTAAHSNVIYAFKNFQLAKGERLGFDMPFFDIRNDKHVRAELWLLGNLAMGLMDLFYGINQKHQTIIFSEDFIVRLKTYEARANKIKQQFLAGGEAGMDS